ncbi:helix-turn-helix domain-containing protein [Streptomyces sp. NPDC046870]|uniref:helix-turn-helix domain-containing protein n=1 Tax=Streptomyces sp. NPDC046870 TaxID=3155135 RepID=UPI003451BCF4
MLEQPHFGRRLKRLRLERGLSQAGLVGDGMSTGYLSRLESGERRPTERATAYLAQRLGVDASALIGPAHQRSLTCELAAVLSAPSGTYDIAALGRAVDEDAGDDPAARWQALWLLSRAAGRLGDYPQERGHLRQLLELSELLEVPELRVRSYVQYARCMRALGDMRTAEPAAAQAFSLARAEELSVSDTTSALMALIGIEVELGRLDAAARHVDELERDWLPVAVPAQAAEGWWTVAMVRNRQGDHASARTGLETALRLLEGRDDLTLWIRLRAAAAADALEMSPPRLAAAERWLTEAASVVDLIGTPVQVQELRALQAHLAFHRGRTNEARAISGTLLAEEDLRLPYRDRVRLSVLDGRLMILSGRVDDGIDLLQRLGRQAAESQNLDLAAHVWQSLAQTLADLRLPHTADSAGTTPQPSDQGGRASP